MLAKFPIKKEAERRVLIRKLDDVIHKCCLCLEDSNQNKSLCCSACQAPASFSALPLHARAWLLLSPPMAPLDNNREVTEGQVFESWEAPTQVLLGRDVLYSPGIQPSNLSNAKPVTCTSVWAPPPPCPLAFAC